MLADTIIKWIIWTAENTNASIWFEFILDKDCHWWTFLLYGIWTFSIQNDFWDLLWSETMCQFDILLINLPHVYFCVSTEFKKKDFGLIKQYTLDFDREKKEICFPSNHPFLIYISPVSATSPRCLDFCERFNVQSIHNSQ